MTGAGPAAVRSPLAALLPALAVAVALLLAWRAVVVALDQPGGKEAAEPASAAGARVVAQDEAGWRALLARNPGDYAALLLLGLDLERQGRVDEARAAVEEALRLAPASQQVLLQAAGFAARHGDDGAALARLRRAVELYPQSWETVWPAFAAALSSGRAPAFFANAARENASWWPGFFAFACEKGGDLDALQQVLSVRLEQRTATAAERRCLIARLAQAQQWQRAYQLWLNGLPPSQRQRVGYVFNGGFEDPISNLGFDWVVPPREGVRVEQLAASGAGGRQALRVEFVNQRWSGPPVQQTLLLPPGRYAFEGRGRAQALDTWLGVQWALYCTGEKDTLGRQLGRSDRWSGTTQWLPIAFDFAVGRDCPVQVLRLELANPREDAAVPGDVAARLRGTAWFDDFRVRRLD